MPHTLIFFAAPQKWTAWGTWSSCSKNCTGGVQFRSRGCGPAPKAKAGGDQSDMSDVEMDSEVRPCNAETPCFSK